ncbi:uncharacterized protein LOC110687918 [Chenopodium quinoa]|uniref:uncharacterized protein LOC110687918 n=1 Tax=Chenopodium quinoa TaxID=63459 RepID=UPI000B77A41F|nr:uncharacterized protein LOC110687918 [Chenopodium quinoa]XP_021720254.1 uncharacterized protein LOC110687918 [Chenopodium quinoa]XP_021720255.1 uncharacterized protein LOC110687918 [Chenopodium quinoa]XP_021720256.1 uncharacterized protein LOC110687918 [Chenopodium quinoa]
MGIEKEQSSGAQRGQVEEKRILMLALNSERVDDRLEDGTKRLSVGLTDFHLVDLKQNELRVSRCRFPSLIMVEFTDAMMSLNDKFLYIVGGVTPPTARSPEFQQLQLASPLSNRTHYFGGSSLDMSNEAAVWCPAPVFIEGPTTSNYVSFLGKIYNFGSDRLEPEVLDPAAVGHCNKPISPIPIPESLAGCSVSVPAVPDPSNKRILMRLYGGPFSLSSLYAFTPDDGEDGIGTWDCLASDFQVWADSSVVVNGVIYLHSRKFPSLLCAFHIDKKKWLKVWWDSCFKDKDNNNLDMNGERIYFDAMLHLGNNILCFAGWTPVYPSPAVCTLEIVFFKFEVLVTGETVIIKACDSYSYYLPKTKDVLRFLSISRVG